MVRRALPLVIVAALVTAVSLVLPDIVPMSGRPMFWLLRDVDSGDYDAASRALGELGRRRTDDAIAALIDRIERDHPMRLTIEDVLGSIGQPAIPQLAVLLERGSEEPRRIAAAALGKTKHADAFEPLAKSIANAQTPSIVRLWAIGALRSVPGDASEQLLLQLVQADNNAIALAAAGALADKKSVASVPLIASICDKQNDVMRRGDCVKYIGRVGGREAARYLAGRLRRESSAYVRFELAEFLGGADDPEVSSALDAAAVARQLEVIAQAHPYFLRVEPPLDDQLIIDAYVRLGGEAMGAAMRASRRPALVKAVAAEAAKPVKQPKMIEAR